ncbi:hypothetical protein [Gluconacetobacter diazotrophicus]|nr:hypothetical protein [Gluconacetobacter diazotrophicus]
MVLSPSEIMQIQKSSTATLVDGVPSVLFLQRNGARYYFDNSFLEPSDNQIDAAISFYRSGLKWSLSRDECRALLVLNPKARIKLADYGDVDSEVRDLLADAVAQTLLGCSWPRYGDKVDISEFTALLHTQAAAIGFGSPVGEEKHT